ncbi:hypothetical protein LBMAG18_01430 [Alphaproteobacteria bacterium]|nr:hypothetical protein LBMAG18_01430 [Alphaproteobacteria bacterium]
MFDNYINQVPIGIFAGQGQLPKILIDDCLKRNRKFIVFLLKSEIYEIDYSQFNPIQIAYGEVDKFLKILLNNKINHIVFIGGVTKPNFSALKVDKKGAILLAKIIANKILGDDAVLRTVVSFFEKEGFKILRIDQLLDCVFSNKGTQSKLLPSTENIIDIDIGVMAIKHFAKFDIGQAVVVAQKQIIAVEAQEGTDEMIKRCKNLRGDFTKNAILIKMKKPQQIKKVDLPTIGPDTIKICIESNIKGIAIQANSAIVVNKSEVIKMIDDNQMFLKII